MLNTVLSSRVSRVGRVRVRVSVRFSGRYKNLGPPFIGLPIFVYILKVKSVCVSSVWSEICFSVMDN